VQYPIELLNPLELRGVPSYLLSLRPGAFIIILRNLDPPELCNGTRLVVKQLLLHVVQAKIFTGVGKGEDIFIPRTPITSSDLSFQLKELQFLIKLSHAMTINKAQGQTIRITMLKRMSPCFSYGQLYVGCSKVG